MQAQPHAADTGGVGLSANSFADVYVEHMPEITRYCRSILRDREDAEDAAQSAMERALRALGDGAAEPRAMRPWLFTIAQREALTLLRRRRHATVELDESTLGPQGSAEELAAVRERLAQLLADVRELSPRQREVLVARELGGRSYRQIAASLGTSEAAAQQLVLEARQSLRQFEDGRSLACDDVRSWISAHDHARIRTRRVRAHLRGCCGCRGFQHAIADRRRDFGLLLPGLGGGGFAWPWLAALFGGGGKLAAAGVVAVAGASLVTFAPLTAEHPDPSPSRAPATGPAPTPSAVPALVAASTRLGTRPRPRAGATSSPRRRAVARRVERARARGVRPVATAAPAATPGAAASQPGAPAPREATPPKQAAPPAPAATAEPEPAAAPTAAPAPVPALDPVLDSVAPVLDTVTDTVGDVIEQLPLRRTRRNPK